MATMIPASELLARRVPDLMISAARTTNESTNDNRLHRDWQRPWDFRQEVQEFFSSNSARLSALKVPDIDHQGPRNSDTYLVANESGVQGRYVANVLSPIGIVLTKSAAATPPVSFQCGEEEHVLDFCFTDGSAERGGTQYADLLLINKGLDYASLHEVEDMSLAVIEMKTPWATRLQNINLSRAEQNPNIIQVLTRTLGQPASYAKQLSSRPRLFVLSTYTFTIFVHQTEHFVYYVSDAIRHDETEPSLRECWLYFASLGSDMTPLTGGTLMTPRGPTTRSMTASENIRMTSEDFEQALIEGQFGTPLNRGTGIGRTFGELEDVTNRPHLLSSSRNTPQPASKDQSSATGTMGHPPLQIPPNRVSRNTVFLFDTRDSEISRHQLEMVKEIFAGKRTRKRYFEAFSEDCSVIVKAWPDAYFDYMYDLPQTETCNNPNKYLAETTAYERLKNSPYVPRLVASGYCFGSATAPKGAVIAVEKVNGTALTSRIILAMSAEQQEALREDLRKAFSSFHKVGIVYTDLNFDQGNLFWDEDARVVTVIDFEGWWWHEEEYGDDYEVGQLFFDLNNHEYL